MLVSFLSFFFFFPSFFAQTLYAELAGANKPSDAEADLKAAFAAMDSDKAGKISKKMLRHFLTSVGEKLSAAEADALLAGCPDNVDYAAFKKAVLGN